MADYFRHTGKGEKLGLNFTINDSKFLSISSSVWIFIVPCVNGSICQFVLLFLFTYLLIADLFLYPCLMLWVFVCLFLHDCCGFHDTMGSSYFVCN